MVATFGLSPGWAANSFGGMESADEGFQIQGELDFESGNSDGFENWRRRQKATLEAVRDEWSLPVGLRARVRLRHVVGELVGKLLLVENPTVLDRHLPLKLRMSRVDFISFEIEDWCIEEEEE